MKLESLRAVFSALSAARVRYLAVGGLAVNAYGHVRATSDLDIILAFETANLRAALACLKSLGYDPRVPAKLEDFADECVRRAWIQEKGMRVFQVVSDQHPTVPIDIFVTIDFDFGEEEKRSLRFPLAPGVEITVVSLERLIRLKREAGRPKDLLDLEALDRGVVEEPR